MKCLLTSSGLSNTTLLFALEKLTKKPVSETSILFITTAANTSFEDKRWLIQNIEELDDAGFKSIDVLDVAGLSKDVWMPHFDHADVLCVGGGDENYLAKILRESDIKNEVISFLERKVYVGISAGSMVLGRFIPNYAKNLFPEEDFGSEDVEPLEVLDFAFIPHMNSDYFKHVRMDVLESLKTTFTMPVYATDDHTAVFVDNDLVEIVGEGEYWASNNLN